MNKSEDQIPDASVDQAQENVPVQAPPPPMTMAEVVDAAAPFRTAIEKLQEELGEARSEAKEAQEELAEFKRRHAQEADARALIEAREFAARLDLGATEEIAQALHQLRKSDASAAIRMEFALRRASEKLRYNRLVAELGPLSNGYTSRSGAALTARSLTMSTATAHEEAEALAQELRKSERGLTREQALDQVYEENPDLFNRCMEEGVV